MLQLVIGKKPTAKTVSCKSFIYMCLMCVVFGIITASLRAQETTLRQEFLKSLNDKGFEEFVVEMNTFSEKASALMEAEAVKSGFICEQDNDLGELRFAGVRYVYNTYQPPELQTIFTAYLKSLTFKQSSLGSGRPYIQLVPNYDIADKLTVYLDSGIGLTTVIHSIIYEDGSFSEDQFTFENAVGKMSSDKKIIEIKATISLEYPKIKYHKITKRQQKITVGDESMEIRIKENKVQISIPENNSQVLTLNTTQQINALHKSKKTLKSVSDSQHKVIDTKSLSDLNETVRIVKKTLQKVNAKKITTSAQLIKEIESIPDSGLNSNWNINYCYYGKVDEVQIYYNTGDDHSITEKVTVKPYQLEP